MRICMVSLYAPPVSSIVFTTPSASPCRGQKPLRDWPLPYTQALIPHQGIRDVTALRCSEPLRSKVGGPSKVLAELCGMDRAWGKLCSQFLTCFFFIGGSIWAPLGRCFNGIALKICYSMKYYPITVNCRRKRLKLKKEILNLLQPLSTSSAEFDDLKISLILFTKIS